MLGRLASGVALASMATLVLVGCSPAEPNEDEVMAEIHAAFDGFNAAIDARVAEGSIEPAHLRDFATEELSTQWAGDVQASLDEGTVSRGVSELVDVELVELGADEVSTRLCTDGRNIETTLEDGSVITPAELVAWSADFVRERSESRLVLAALEPIADQSICEQ
jgi:hypothetical protein